MEDESVKRTPSIKSNREVAGAAGESDQRRNPSDTSSPLQRMQRILSHSTGDREEHWSTLLEELPEEARNILKTTSEQKTVQPASEKNSEIEPRPESGLSSAGDSLPEKMPQNPEAAKSPSPLPLPIDDQISKADALAQSMRDRGYLIEEDSTGIRLGGTPIMRGSKSSIMSASELVQLAAEMEGGILPPEERVHCPHCDAVIKAGDTRCPWCSKDIDLSPGEQE
ncbi:MAG: hypothetical protein JXA25_01110 [Anaerolineales bacterium]|nr:hypothetical protein [Anaerolineales bacterium]